MLQWLRANGCPWDAHACYYAAQGGHLAVLQWAVANGCPWDRAACLRDGAAEVLEWIREQGEAGAEGAGAEEQAEEQTEEAE